MRSWTTNPVPSSVTSTTTPPSMTEAATWIRVAWECLSTLVRASAMFLNTTDSTSLGRSSGNCRSTSGSMPVLTRRVSRRSRIASLSPTVRSRASGLTVVSNRRKESSTFLMVAARGDVGQELPPGSHRLFQPLDRDVELLLGLAVLPHETCGHRGDAQQPCIVGGEPAPGVIGRERSDAPNTCRPGDRDRVAHRAQAACAPQLVERRAGAVAQLEVVVEDDSFGDAVAVTRQRNPEDAHRRLRREAKRFSLDGEGSMPRQAPERYAACTH